MLLIEHRRRVVTFAMWALTSFAEYRRAWLTRDAVAGLTVWARGVHRHARGRSRRDRAAGGFLADFISERTLVVGLLSFAIAM
jgi:hypothetical protein